MDPAVALGVEAASSLSLRVLLVWHAATASEPEPFLVGAWLGALRASRLTWPFRGFVSPTTPVAYLGTPVVDAAFAEPVFSLLLAELRDNPALPGFAEIGDFSAGLVPALTSALERSNMSLAIVEKRQRAHLLPKPDPEGFWAKSRSRAHIKNLARQRRKLSESGRLELTVGVSAAETEQQLEEFLVIEASGWKGSRGSALASQPETVATVRRMIQGLALRDRVKIHTLRLDGRPVVMSILLYAGKEAFTWRIAFDETFRRYSPGIQLLEDVTLDLLRDPGVERTDSCNHRDTGFQAERWSERHELVDILIGTRRHSAVVVWCLAARERFLRRAKDLARHALKAARHRWASGKEKPKA
ncbi:MAG: GNAT family N-acetyltransferase [Hyphomicrobiales bacterium]|nr:MAG: GNAT family N-acetyltransferase [Hyphomicrobiales bacterium]